MKVLFGIIIVGVFLITLNQSKVLATNVFGACNSNSTANSTKVCQQVSGSSGNPVSSIIASVINIISYISGFVAVILIVLSGLKYITSGGDSKKVSQAKDTLTYAIIGVVIVIIAQAILNFVFGSLK